MKVSPIKNNEEVLAAREPEKPSKLKKPSLFQMINYPPQSTVEKLAFMLIRPPRFVYNPEILKPNKRNSQRFTVQTIDIGFELTFYKQEEMRYVVLYLHGNGSSRFEGCLFLSSIPDNVGLACFDFNGCGNRQQADYITLGQKQSKDVDIAAKYLKERGYKVIGWGRSMGAVSLLKSTECDIMIADSAYSDLTELCKQSSSNFLPRACCCIFHMFFPCFFSCLKCKIESMSGLQIEQMNISEHLRQISEEKKTNKQICFIHGEEDTLIPKEHASKLFEAFKGRKMLIYFEGTHNSTRQEEVIKRCFQFIEEGLERERVESSGLPQKIKTEKTVELHHVDKIDESDRAKRPSVLSTKPFRIPELNQKDASNFYLRTEYSSGPMKKTETSPLDSNHEDYQEEKHKIQVILREKQQESPATSTFREAAVAKQGQISTNNGNSHLSSSKKQVQVLQKLCYRG